MATGFSYQLQLSLLLTINVRICGLDFLFALLLQEEGRRFPSSLYTFTDAAVCTWLGIATPTRIDPGGKVSPNLRSYTSGVSAGALKFYFKSCVSTNSTIRAWVNYTIKKAKDQFHSIERKIALGMQDSQNGDYLQQKRSSACRRP